MLFNRTSSYMVDAPASKYSVINIFLLHNFLQVDLLIFKSFRRSYTTRREPQRVAFIDMRPSYGVVFKPLRLPEASRRIHQQATGPQGYVQDRKNKQASPRSSGSAEGDD